jgi:hypothetical protein
MGLLERLLAGPACRHSGWRSRNGIAAVRKRARGIPGDVESCARCRSQQHRERQYLERLHGAAVPEASGDLTARLLARTGQLAAERSATDAPRPARGERPWIHLPALAAGGATAAVALMAGAAYLMGAEAAPLADGAESSAFSRQGAPAPLIPGSSPISGGSLLPGASLLSGNPEGAEPGPGLGWSLAGRPDFTPAGALSAEQLATLRSQGWAGPELRELGYHIVWARGGVVAGEEILELRLTDGRHFATVLEQHGLEQSGPGQSSPGLPQHSLAAGQQSAPVNVLTGHTAAADGFTASELDEVAPPPGGGTLWINTAGPYTAIYQTPTATFTYVSELPAEQADDAVAALVRAPAGASAGTPSADGFAERMERGLGRILELLAP